MSFRLGLTGSIGMGKSTTAQMFADLGCAVWDADAAVHRLYDVGGAAVAKLGEIFPQALVDGAISRVVLKDIIASDPTALPRIEGIVHPLVVQDRQDFIASAQADILVFDIPLLFETGGDAHMDAVAVVHVDAATQKARVLARGTMTEAQFLGILSKQMPINEKLARATYKIETETLSDAQQQVQMIVHEIRNILKNA